MKALIYLVLTQIKNKILSLKKKPAFLILYGFIAIVVIFSIVMLILFGKDMTSTGMGDERILFLILSALGLFFLYAFTASGLSTGSSLFTMPDVGLLFVAPVSPKKILMYGLLSTLGKSLLGSIFIFYQIGNLKANFGYGFREILALFLIFALMTLFCQLMSIGIYIFSNQNETRKRLVKMILYTILGGLLLAVVILQRQQQLGLFEVVLRVVDSPWFGYIPVAGWACMFFAGIVHHSLSMVIISLALFLVTGTLIVILLTLGKADYYEDVLLSTEYTFQVKTAAKEGRNMPVKVNKKIKIKEDDSVIRNGRGAMTLFYRHILEYKRKSRFVFLDAYSAFMIVGTLVVGYNFRMKNAPNATFYGILAVSIYFQYFMTMFGKLKVELTKPYIYLLPEPSMKKVFAASLTSLLKPCVDGVCIFGALAIISGTHVLECIIFMLAYAASGAVFTGMTILYQRVLGGQPNKVVQMFIGMGLLFAVMAPSIGVSVLAAYLLPATLQFLCMLPYTFFCLLFALLLFVTCGNLIDKAEYTGKL